ncbi:superkiller viralicidic activity 2-like 2 [Plakobranchus ocellatus]|uniref:Superkiller viralicidic activity 2-like 2 n=1 Tax=Plakobranchus ocellatus TaxID=259542 RepID=A0AAV3Y3U0_9GAST|nr:superkiller viralicidic activity 2-like 2 [Plakobranchus ocellatus]
MGIKEKTLTDTIKKIEAFEERLYSHPLHKDSRLKDLYDQYEKKAKVCTFFFFFLCSHNNTQQDFVPSRNPWKIDI